MEIQVRSGHGTVTRDGEFTDVVDTISRMPKQHKGWESIAYEKRRYEVFGGIRTPYFINLSNPLKRRG
jgi:hypothetical protein